jgi:formylglycine-generating enzyme required for sulfatase activity
MKTLFFIILLLNTTVSFTQKKANQKPPPGTVQINDTLFVDRTEIANVHWREYLFYLENFDSLNAYRALPDTLVWRDTAAYNESMVDSYFRFPGFNDYPVVGISYEQAVEFCKWRSDRVNELYSHVSEDKRPYKKVTYRLLSKQEWETFASGTLPVEKYPYGYDSSYRKWKKKYRHCFKCQYPGYKKPDPSSMDIFYYTAPAKSFWPNSFNLYNMIGNVAEMISEKGIAKGGSFEHKLEDCKIVNDQHYINSERWLGFRCVAVITK